MESAPEACVICGASERELLIEKDGWQVHRCSLCGLGFLDPRPSEKEIERLYQEDYFSSHYDDGLQPGSSQFRKRIRQEDHRIRFIKTVKRSGRLLDLGCGYGYFLAACRDYGYEVEGLDVSDYAAQYAIDRLRLPITIGDPSAVSFEPHSFDIITMWHFLEHSRDPQLPIAKAKHWLKRDGILVIDVPNHVGTDARLIWEKWDGWSLPYHFYHFTPQSLTRLLGLQGFEVIRKKNYHSEVVKEKLKGIPIISLLARLIAKMYSGTSIATISKLTV